MGYVLGYGEAKCPGQYIFIDRKGSPVTNDGYKVTNAEAKAMALVAKGYVSVKEFINKEWQSLPEETRLRHKNAPCLDSTRPLYIPEVGEEFLTKIRKFAEFAEKSKGFRIR
jgi:hypothetical protein